MYHYVASSAFSSKVGLPQGQVCVCVYIYINSPSNQGDPPENIQSDLKQEGEVWILLKRNSDTEEVPNSMADLEIKRLCEDRHYLLSLD